VDYAYPLDVELPAALRVVRRLCGKSIAAQLAEAAMLALTGNRLSPLDYFRFRLWDDATYDWAEKRRFVGDRRCEEVARRTVDRRWAVLVSDKLVSAAYLERQGFAMPRIRAVHHPTRSHPGAIHLPDDAALVAWLREARTPVFAKPLFGHQSRGALRIDAVDPAADTLLLHDGTRLGIEAFVASLGENLATLRLGRSTPHPAYLFQDVVVQHPEVAARCGEAVGCVRAMVGVEPGVVHELAWVWKLPGPGQPADNFSRAGTLLAGLDPATGEVRRVVRGSGLGLESFEKSPYTGEPLVGFRIPHFAAVREAILRGAALLPGVGVQSWDVAVGPDGPVVLEANPAGTHSLLQLATGRGLWTEEVRAFLRRAERANPTRPRGLARLGWTGHPLGRVHGAAKLLLGSVRRGR